MRTISEMLERQHTRAFRSLEVADLDAWAMVHEWLLVETRVDDEYNIHRYYLTPIGNKLSFFLGGMKNEDIVYFDGVV